MAVIHQTTIVPSKDELLTAWLPTRAWYQGAGQPVVRRVGGFRLDDPEGEVGIEFIVVQDTSGEQPVTYQVPFAYRGAALAGAEEALVGTAMHGVLGKRWFYDGTRDPVVVAQILALLAGKVQPQAQHDSGAVDQSVAVAADEIVGGAAESASATDGPTSTDITVGDRLVRVERILRAGSAPARTGHVTAPWRLPDGGTARGVFLTIGEISAG
ncbi:maltokinase N-terminal cap-like domain-containing protein [Nocardia altamirensis]|uniref:maltokinase N-terminal cap-like domain-containing protein n=1 Tax=Nocardia altamirensis TaxID=472158 RepID=UPI00084048D1|nr:1,4-alpha-glucan branching protein [Nocardia altamirensis]